MKCDFLGRIGKRPERQRGTSPEFPPAGMGNTASFQVTRPPE
jgi:hypothetical protein